MPEVHPFSLSSFFGSNPTYLSTFLTTRLVFLLSLLQVPDKKQPDGRGCGPKWNNSKKAWTSSNIFLLRINGSCEGCMTLNWDLTVFYVKTYSTLKSNPDTFFFWVVWSIMNKNKILCSFFREILPFKAQRAGGCLISLSVHAHALARSRDHSSVMDGGREGGVVRAGSSHTNTHARTYPELSAVGGGGGGGPPPKRKKTP